jgi:hypothetical protein
MPDSVPPGSDDDEAAAAGSPSQPPPTLEDESPVKAALERIKHAEQLQARMQAQYPQQIPQQAQTPQPPQLSQWKLDFLKANPELVENEEATSLTRYTYLAALRRGIRDDTPAMNEAILAGWSRMRGAVENVSHKPEREEPPVNAPEPRRSMPVSAPVSRGAPDLSSGRSIPQRITLSATEVEIARNSYSAPDMTNEQKERAYAMAKLRMIQMRKDGTLNE